MRPVLVSTQVAAAERANCIGTVMTFWQGREGPRPSCLTAGPDGLPSCRLHHLVGGRSDRRSGRAVCADLLLCVTNACTYARASSNAICYSRSGSAAFKGLGGQEVAGCVISIQVAILLLPLLSQYGAQQDGATGLQCCPGIGLCGVLP